MLQMIFTILIRIHNEKNAKNFSTTVSNKKLENILLKMTPSWISMSISMFLKSQTAFLLALDPLRQISADLNKAKDVLALIQDMF